jgi:hypothetical protein
VTEATFSTARIARIAASIDLEPEAKADILAASDLDEESWERIEEDEDLAIRHALGKDDPSRLRAYDAAYLSRIEEERGTVTKEEYASILDATTRTGDSSARFQELEIPEASEMVLVRVFEQRNAEEPRGA